METFIERCVPLMNSQGMTQRELARRIGKSHQSVNNWFSSRHMTPKTNDAVLVAQALNTTVEYLVTGISADSQSLTPQEMKLFQIVKGLSPEKLQDIIVIAGAFSDKPTEEVQYMKTKMDQFNSK